MNVTSAAESVLAEASSVPYKHESKTPKANYTYTSTVKEGKSETWGVQFCPRPTLYQLEGRGQCWKRRTVQRNAEAGYIAQGRPVPKRLPAASYPPDKLDSPMPLRKGKSFPARFATANGNSARVYEATPYKKPRLLCEFEDADKEECFYTVCWTYNADNKAKWWLCAAGEKGIVRVIDLSTKSLHDTLTGHGDAVYDIKVHPRDPALLVSASKDNTVRMWNLRTGATVAIFLGFEGHRWTVVNVDFDICGHRMVTSGMDNSIRIWDITDDNDVLDAIVESHKSADIGVQDRYCYVEDGVRKRLKCRSIQRPVYNSKNLHKEVVDCAMWVGNLVLSKSVSNRMYLWNPGADRWSLSSLAKGKDAVPFVVLDEYKVKNCDKWFVKFCFDRERRIVACGAEKGAVHLFRLDQLPVEPMCVLHPKPSSKKIATSYVRQCSFSDDGSIIVSVDDNGFINQYDRVSPKSRKRATPDPEIVFMKDTAN